MKTKISERVYHALLNSICSGEISHNDLIMEQAIATQYGISKLTAREILQRLCHDKYLQSYPRKGYVILTITPEQCKQIQQVRYQLEAFCLRQIIHIATSEEINELRILSQHTTTHIDNPYDSPNSRFHLSLARFTKNEYIYDSIYQYLGFVTRCITSFAYPDPVENDPLHDLIIDALLQRKEDLALEYLRQDLRLLPEEV